VRRSGFLILAAMTACSASDLPITTRGHAIDADTISIPVRLSGIDAFEYHQQCKRPDGSCWTCGRDAQNYTARFLGNRTISVTLEKSKTFDRSVGTVTADGEDLGLALILAGYAVPIPRFLRSDPERLDVYNRAFERARANRTGGFSGEWTKPEDWRRGVRLPCESRQ
jgi:micrococcal nuclease